MARITETVKTLLIANILVFIGSQLVGEQAVQYLALWFPENAHFKVWQLVTHMFMHASVAHIFFNMFALWMFGSVLEQTIGQKRFLFLYFSAGFAAAGLQLLFSYYNFTAGFQELANAGMSSKDIHALVHNAYSQMLGSGQYSVNVPQHIDGGAVKSMIASYMTPMVGASGAIFGVLAAFAIVYPNLPLYLFLIPVPIKAKYLIGGYFLLEVFSGVTNVGILGPSNTAHWAHVGGAVLGFAVMWYWKRHQFNHNQWS